jgi:hypothetical protein
MTHLNLKSAEQIKMRPFSQNPLTAKGTKILRKVRKEFKNQCFNFASFAQDLAAFAVYKASEKVS